MLEVFARKTNKHKWNVMGRTDSKNKHYVNMVYCLFRDAPTWKVGYMDTQDMKVTEVPFISYDEASKMIQFLDNGIVSITPPFMGKLIAYGLLNSHSDDIDRPLEFE